MISYTNHIFLFPLEILSFSVTLNVQVAQKENFVAIVYWNAKEKKGGGAGMTMGERRKKRIVCLHMHEGVITVI